MGGPERILVRAPNFVGDHVMALPFYRGLRAAYPRARLAVAAPEAVLGLSLAGVFDETVALSPRDRRFPRGAWHAGRRLRAAAFDLGIGLPASFSSSLFLAAAAIPHRVGFAQAGADVWLTHAIPWKGRASGRHKAALYLDLLEALTGRAPALAAPAALPRAPERLIVVAPGASLPLREWPYFPELLRGLREGWPGHTIAVVGGPGDAKWSGVLKRLDLAGVEDLVGRTTLDELAALCARAILVVANDSGPAHVAATLAGAPTLVLFGPGDPRYVAPLGPTAEAVHAEGPPCRPCESARCRAPYGYQACLRSLSAGDVLSRAARLL